MKKRSCRLFISLLFLLIPYSAKAQCRPAPYPVNEIPEATSGFRHPLDVDDINSGYNFAEQTEPRYCNSRKWVHHPGKDMNGPLCCGNENNGDRDKGTAVYATAIGKVVYVDSSKWGGIVIQHNYRGIIYYSQYGHIRRPEVVCGELVPQGKLIAEISDEGTDDAHLHFEIRKANHPDPLYGSFFGVPCGTGLQNLGLVHQWYENPLSFIGTHPPYSERNGSFSISSIGTRTITQWDGTVLPITVQSNNGFNAPILLEAFNLPPGYDRTQTEMRPETVTPNSGGTAWAQLILYTTAQTQTGTFNITIRGTSGNIVRECVIELKINPVVTGPDFSLNINSGQTHVTAQTIRVQSTITKSINQGDATVFVIDVLSVNGFTGSVRLEAFNLPPGYDRTQTEMRPETVELSPNGTAIAQLILYTTHLTQPGRFYITIRGTSGARVKEEIIELTINPIPLINNVMKIKVDDGGKKAPNLVNATTEQYYVKIEGVNFNPSVVEVVVVGPGCPNLGNCVVPNSILRGYSSDTTIRLVPLTLQAGTYEIRVRNGGPSGTLSNPWSITFDQ